jgi:aspartate kinase
LNLPDWERRRADLEARLGGAIALAPGAAIVSVVGDGLTTSERGLPRFLAALARAGVAEVPEAVVAGPLRIGACIDAERLTAAQRSLHAEFVAPAGSALQ